MLIIFVLFVKIFIMFAALTVHEFAHGYVAYRLGDNTAKYSGRLTLNPLAHIDPVGTVAFPIGLLILSGGRFTFGWAKPVPINFWALNQPKRDILWVGLAGPFANIITAFLCSRILVFVPVGSILFDFLISAIIINLLFAIFNLIPIPPLDGSRVLFSLLPSDLAASYMRMERYGFVILIVLVYLGVIGKIIFPIVLSLAVKMGVPINFFW